MQKGPDKAKRRAKKYSRLKKKELPLARTGGGFRHYSSQSKPNSKNRGSRYQDAVKKYTEIAKEILRDYSKLDGMTKRRFGREVIADCSEAGITPSLGDILRSLPPPLYSVYQSLPGPNTYWG